ncbi:Pseudouridine synthase [Elaphomyces granulatus]|jgi:tRNA pseudouridine38-40 synthase
MGGKRDKKRELGRTEHYRLSKDKREKDEGQPEAKRQRIEGEQPVLPIYATKFSPEDIAAEERRPKKKVAILLGYSGTGYYGMQLSNTQKTIEGELFAALVAVGAISKANAADPKKSSLVRCARTDKGVHAAGNIVSLKLIVEDPDLVPKINQKLSHQIRVWGIQVTNKSFSCYQMCDSRVYEYLIPSYCFLPPHPSTHLGKKIVELAEQASDTVQLHERQEEVMTFWDEVDKRCIKPILEGLPGDVRRIVERSLYIEEDATSSATPNMDELVENEHSTERKDATEESMENSKSMPNPQETQRLLINEAIKSIKAAYVNAKRKYRIHPKRISRLQETLSKFVGTKNFHNYTIQKVYRDPSARRHIRSFVVNPEPIIVDKAEWLSLKVHGQSFMMHQIRKMVSMAALIVRCGCDPNRISESFGPTKLAIPKAPGLGLLLERPIFDNYNKKVQEFGKEKIDFSRYDQEIEEFKRREIYGRIFHEEGETNTFASFFNHIDHYQKDYFLYLTSGGLAVATVAPEPFSTSRSVKGGKTSEEQGCQHGDDPKCDQKKEEGALAALESDPESVIASDQENG